MRLMDDFNDAKRYLYEHVGFERIWDEICIKDRTDMVWQVFWNRVKCASSIEDLASDDKTLYYQDSLHTRSGYPTGVYRGEELTMIVQYDSLATTFYAFYSNEMEVPSPEDDD